MMNYEPLLSYNVKAELARRNYLDFVKYVKPNYDANWHHILLCEYLQKFISGEIKRLMVFMPPQHGKSELVSRNLPAYILGLKPTSKIILSSYSATLSSTFNRDCQRVIDSPAYHDIFPDTKLNGSNVVTVASSWLRNSEIFETVGYGGFLKTTGVGGSLTGTPADFAIIDDPVKDSLEAMSATYQFRNWNWYNDVLYTRIHNNTGILVTQTRWDINDLSGILLKNMENETGEQWVVLCLPAVKVDNDNLDDPREIGEALWPQRHSLEKLNLVRSQSVRTYESLYQQNPQPTQAGGEFYKEFRVALHVKDVLKIEGFNYNSKPYNPNVALHVSFDFNVNPYMTCTIWQIIGKRAIQIAEICLKSPSNTTKAVCNEIKRLYNGHQAGMFVYGDPNGKKEDTRSEKGFNDYTIIRSELSIFKPTLKIQSAAPSVVMRGNFINTVFSSEFDGLEITIDSKCVNSIADYLYLKEDSDGTKLKEKAKDVGTGSTYEKYGHTSDANDYLYTSAFAAEFEKYKRGGGNALLPTVGRNISKNNY